MARVAAADEAGERPDRGKPLIAGLSRAAPIRLEMDADSGASRPVIPE
jgi:hypothetical protein